MVQKVGQIPVVLFIILHIYIFLLEKPPISRQHNSASLHARSVPKVGGAIAKVEMGTKKKKTLLQEFQVTTNTSLKRIYILVANLSFMLNKFN